LYSLLLTLQMEVTCFSRTLIFSKLYGIISQKVDLFIHFIVAYVRDPDRLCGLVVRVLDYRCRGPGFDYRALQKKK
jgi:hypothetical protein